MMEKEDNAVEEVALLHDKEDDCSFHEVENLQMPDDRSYSSNAT